MSTQQDLIEVIKKSVFQKDFSEEKINNLVEKYKNASPEEISRAIEHIKQREKEYIAKHQRKEKLANAATDELNFLVQGNAIRRNDEHREEERKDKQHELKNINKLLKQLP